VPNEIVVVDQSDALQSTLARLATDRSCEIRYLWTQSVGLSRGNNTGIASSRNDILVFTHDDVLVTPSWYLTLVQTLVEAGRRAVVTGQVLPTPQEQTGSFVQTVRVSDVPALYKGRIGTDVLIPFNMAMYRSAVDEIGDFDERLGPGTSFPAAEDNDYGFRLLEAGYRIIYVPDALLYHRAWRSKRDYLPLRWSYGRGQGAFYANISACGTATYSGACAGTSECAFFESRIEFGIVATGWPLVMPFLFSELFPEPPDGY
jgi:GT2 family glycosyltransferase